MKNMSKRTRNRQDIQPHVWNVADKQESPLRNKPKSHKKVGYFECFRGDLKGWLLDAVIPKKSCFILRSSTPRFQDGGVLSIDNFLSQGGVGKLSTFARKRENEATPRRIGDDWGGESRIHMHIWITKFLKRGMVYSTPTRENDRNKIFFHGSLVQKQKSRENIFHPSRK